MFTDSSYSVSSDIDVALFSLGTVLLPSFENREQMFRFIAARNSDVQIIDTMNDSGSEASSEEEDVVVQEHTLLCSDDATHAWDLAGTIDSVEDCCFVFMSCVGDTTPHKIYVEEELRVIVPGTTTNFPCKCRY